MNDMTTNPFLQWWAAGYRDLIPVVPPDADVSENSYIAKNKAVGKAPGIRYASGQWGGLKGWREHATTEADLADWGAMGASVGLRRGVVFMLDIDALDPELADSIEADAVEMLGPAPCRIGRHPKRALLYRADGDIPNVKLIFEGPDGTPNQIEIPNQAVIQGVHPVTRKPYAWPRKPLALDELTPVTPAALNAFLERQRRKLPAARKETLSGSLDRANVNQSSLTGDPELIKAAIAGLPNSFASHPTYDDMVRLGEALCAATRACPDMGEDLWQQWCARWEGGDYDPELTARRWQTFVEHKQEIGAAWLYDHASAHGVTMNGLPISMAPFIQPIEGEAAEQAEVELNAFELAAQRERDAQHQPGKFTFLDFEDAAASALQEPTPPLVKGLIDQGTMSVLYGDSNVGKTFVAMDLCYHVSTGTPYAGMRTEHALVVYVASEGGRGAKRRLAALKDKFNPLAPPRFKLLPSAVDLRRPDVDLNPFIADLRAIGQPIGLIVIDTLSRALAGGDENSSVDMGALVKHFDAVRSATSAHLMIVHHTGKDRAKGARGHTLLRAATDTEIEVAEGVISVTKQRDLDKAWTAAFELEVRRVGTDADGDPVTSCTVRLEGAARGAAAKVVRAEATPAEAGLLEALGVLVETTGKEAVRMSDIETFMKDKSSDMTKEQVRFHLRNLAAKGHVVRPKRGFWAEKRSTPLSSGITCMPEKESETEGSGGKAEGDIFS